jgi:hypothetical protein
MINKSNNVTVIKSKRSAKESDNKDLTKNTKSGLPVLLEPNMHDIHDELVRMDSFAYSRYNQ